MLNIQKLTEKIRRFRDERDWKKFHNPKDMSLSLVLEAAEVMEHFQWKNEQEMLMYIKSHKTQIGEELSDVLYWILLMSHDLNIDIAKALDRKLAISRKKYPVTKSKGNHKKYTEL